MLRSTPSKITPKSRWYSSGLYRRDLDVVTKLAGAYRDPKARKRRAQSLARALFRFSSPLVSRRPMYDRCPFPAARCV